jgi:hypothetical protein
MRTNMENGSEHIPALTVREPDLVTRANVRDRAGNHEEPSKPRSTNKRSSALSVIAAAAGFA